MRTITLRYVYFERQDVHFGLLWKRDATFCLSGTGKSQIKNVSLTLWESVMQIQKARFCKKNCCQTVLNVFLSRNQTQNFTEV
jgi:hypothetical protein